MAAISPITNDFSWLFQPLNGKKNNSIQNLWNAYGNFQSNSTSALAGLNEINSNLKSLLASYDDAKSAFYSEFSDNMDALSKSAASLKAFNFSSINPDGAISTSADVDGNLTTTYSNDLQLALDTVKSFVNDYNASINFFNDNASVSNRVDKLAQSFGDAGYRASLYNSIGLSVGSGGTLELDENKLANAIINDPNKVSSILGKDIVAG